MRLLTTLLTLQLVVTAYGILRLGTINSGLVNGTVYLIDANSIFLFEFSTTNNLVFSGSSGSSTYELTGPVDGVNMWFNLSNDVLDSHTISVHDGSTLIASFYVPDNVYVPCNAEYLGQFARPGQSTAHDLDGHVFLDRPQRRIFIAGLDYDGSAPAAFFWLDTSPEPTAAGVRAGYNGGYDLVSFSSNTDVNITYPRGQINTDFTTLSVWCADVSVSFGHVSIPSASSDSFGCTNTGPIFLGFDPSKHDVAADIYILGPNVIGLRSHYFDGTGPGTWYWAGLTSALPEGYIVPDELNSLAILDDLLEGVDIVLSLPNSTDVCSSYFFSFYCVKASVSFGTVLFSSFSCSGCPTTCKTDVGIRPNDYQCKNLSTSNNFRVEYLYNEADDFITFKFHTCNLEPGQYVAFGLSSSDTGVEMAPNGDPIVCHYTTAGEAICQDYTLTSRIQCANTGSGYVGACPDDVLSGGMDNCYNTQFENVNGITTFTTTRRLTPGDSVDKDFTSNSPRYTLWSIGGTFNSPTGERWVLKHDAGNRADPLNPILIDFSANSTCDTIFQCPTTILPDPTPWTVPPICIDANSEAIDAYIGNTGGIQGYRAITGKDGWGIAWYLNGLLIPEVYVERGSTVRFNVYGGNDDTDLAQYHPFYITDSDEGGIFTSAQAMQPLTEVSYAGLTHNGTTVWGLTTGDYCEWDETGGSGNNYDSWNTYKDTLISTCMPGDTPGTFEWTTNDTSPDTVYYQCATHRLLGWKIHVVDNLTYCESQLGAGYTTLPFSLLLFVAVVLTLFYGF